MKILKRVFLGFVVFIFCQLPVFVDQYRMHLEGHKKEAERVFIELTLMAKSADMPLERYIEKFTSNSDPDIRNQGQFMTNIQNRYLFLCKATESFDNIKAIVRPLVFLGYMDFEIMTETAKSFSPGILVTKEVLLWGCIGLLVGVLFSLKKPKKKPE